MQGPAHGAIVRALVATLAVAAQAAAASARFVPADPQFVVANVRQAAPDAALRELIAHWHDRPDDAATAALAAAFLDRASALREPMYVGRAEALLAPLAENPHSTAAVRRLYAETLQYRHDFKAAESLLDAILEATPFDAATRQQRASVRLVRGDFAGARADCAQLLGGGGVQSIALACLAEAMAGAGQLQRAQVLLAAYPLRSGDAVAARAYFLTVRAELYERGANPDRAIADYRAALDLLPGADPVRAALADALTARGELAAAAALLDVARPSLALTVRHAACASGREQELLRSQALAWLELEAARGDAPHYREAALLALATGDAGRALSAAVANFKVQRELPDVRVLARAAVAARAVSARRELEAWLRQTGFRDAVTENVLAAAAAG